MARRLRDKNIETREARCKLKPSPTPYWRAIGRGLHLGYRKGKTGGVWVVRKFVGDRADTTYKYDVRTIAQADDREDANGDTIIDFWIRRRTVRVTSASRRRQRAATLAPIRSAMRCAITSNTPRAAHLGATCRTRSARTCCPPSVTRPSRT